MTVAGHQVGSVGQDHADQQRAGRRRARHLRLEHHAVRDGHVATIGQLSLTGVANRFVGLSLGAGRSRSAAAARCRSAQTRGIVDLDVAARRADPAGPRVAAADPQDRRVLRRRADARADQPLDPVLQPGAQPDRRARRARSWRTGSRSTGWSPRARRSSTALAAATRDLGGAVTNTAACAARGRRASARRSRTRSPARPAVLHQGTGVLRGRRTSRSGSLNPVLARPAAGGAAARHAAASCRPGGAERDPDDRRRRRRSSRARARRSTALPPVAKQAAPAVKSLTRGAEADHADPRPGCGRTRPTSSPASSAASAGPAAATTTPTGTTSRRCSASRSGGGTLAGLLNLLGRCSAG